MIDFEAWAAQETLPLGFLQKCCGPYNMSKIDESIFAFGGQNQSGTRGKRDEKLSEKNVKLWSRAS